MKRGRVGGGCMHPWATECSAGSGPLHGITETAVVRCVANHTQRRRECRSSQKTGDDGVIDPLVSETGDALSA